MREIDKQDKNQYNIASSMIPKLTWNCWANDQNVNLANQNRSVRTYDYNHT